MDALYFPVLLKVFIWLIDSSTWGGTCGGLSFLIYLKFPLKFFSYFFLPHSVIRFPKFIVYGKRRIKRKINPLLRKTRIWKSSCWVTENFFWKSRLKMLLIVGTEKKRREIWGVHGKNGELIRLQGQRLSTDLMKDVCAGATAVW